MMASPLRPTFVPQCAACLRSYGFGSTKQAWPVEGAAFRQHVRGKKKAADNSSGMLPVRLLKDVKTFGKKGAIVPVAVGQMRNSWFPKRIAEYMTMPELKMIKATSTMVARDFDFGIEDVLPVVPAPKKSDPVVQEFLPVKKAPEVQRITPERATELLQIFIPHRLDFYRQPVIEEQKAPESEPEPEHQETEEEMKTHAKGAAADLLESRMRKPKAVPKPKQPEGPQAIYGSVSTHDVVVAVRAALETNDESKRVALHESDIKIVEAVEQEALTSGRVKHVGEFTVEIKVKGAEAGVRRIVRVNAQEL